MIIFKLIYSAIVGACYLLDKICYISIFPIGMYVENKILVTVHWEHNGPHHCLIMMLAWYHSILNECNLIFLCFKFLYCFFQHGLMTQLLRLAHNCLTFDFIGTSTDESSDDLCTVQIPTSWRPAFLDFSTLKLFFDLYHSLPSTLSPLVSHFSLQYISQLHRLEN
jgi:hypothetical protein